MARVDSFMATFDGQEWPEDRYGGVAVVGSVADLPGLGVGGTGDVGATQHQAFVTHMTLVEFDENQELKPYLAESWEMSEDRTEVTFHLRQDVFWHDGVPTTAEDVVFTYRVLSDPASGYPNQGFFHHYRPGDEGVELLDSHTVRFRFAPHADAMEMWRATPIFPAHLLGDVPVDSLGLHSYEALCPVGNGPFRYLDRRPGESWTFEPNPAFPEALGGRPALDRYAYRVIPEHATLFTELQSGRLDAYVQMLPNQEASGRDNPDLNIESFEYPSIFFVAWNSRRPQLSDARVRRALTLGIDRTQLVEGVQAGGATIINSGVPPVHWAYDSTLADSLAFDPAQARALLDEAGWIDRDGDGIREDAEGNPLELELITNQNQERQEVAELMRVQLLDVGVTVVPVVLEYGAYVDRLVGTREFHGAIVTFETGFRIDERDLFHSEAIDGPYAFSGTMDSELDRFLDTIPLIPDEEEAYPVWQAYQRRIMAVHPYTFLYSANRRVGVNKRIQGATMDERGDWASIRHWWIAPEDRRVR
jgi:peptide/nickel transport system substrate-binding protein